MKLKIILPFALAIIISGCSSASKSTGTSVNTLEPGEAEVKAIQGRYADITLQTLKEGYSVYTGPCVKCHRKKKIYNRSEEEWSKIITKMAPKSKLNALQKEALWKYILAMKATHTPAK